MNTTPSNLHLLFEAQPIGKVVILRATTASNIESHALSNLLGRTCALGEFGHTQKQDGSDTQLTFYKATLERVNSFLADTAVEKLSNEVVMLGKATALRDAAIAEAEKINSLTPLEFGRLLGSRSAEKLILVEAFDGVKLVLKTSMLIPVTHFKTLAKLTKYEGKTKTFTVRTLDLNASTRHQLLQLADKLAKSTKKVSQEDIAARRARKGAAYSHLNAAELERLIEDHMYDVFGFDSAENRKLSREAFSR
jgi:hypothetical protein